MVKSRSSSSTLTSGEWATSQRIPSTRDEPQTSKRPRGGLPRSFHSDMWSLVQGSLPPHLKRKVSYQSWVRALHSLIHSDGTMPADSDDARARTCTRCL